METIVNVYDSKNRTGSFRLVNTWYTSEKWWHCLTPGIIMFSQANVGSDMYLDAGYDIVCYVKYRLPDVGDWAEAEYKSFLRLKNVRWERNGPLITRRSGEAKWLISPGLTTFTLPYLAWEVIS